MRLAAHPGAEQHHLPKTIAVRGRDPPGRFCGDPPALARIVGRREIIALDTGHELRHPLNGDARSRPATRPPAWNASRPPTAGTAPRTPRSSEIASSTGDACPPARARRQAASRWHPGGRVRTRAHPCSRRPEAPGWRRWVRAARDRGGRPDRLLPTPSFSTLPRSRTGPSCAPPTPLARADQQRDRPPHRRRRDLPQRPSHDPMDQT